jgi:hypothetical protein
MATLRRERTRARMSQQSVDELVKSAPETSEPGDHDKFAHYALKHEILQSMTEGIAITALCGKKWIVTRDGEKFPTCPTCVEVWKNLEKD